MPPKAKRQNANPHDKRHENGLAAPGKRITKERSNGNLDGHTNGKSLAGPVHLHPDAAGCADQHPSQSYDAHLNGLAVRPDLRTDGQRNYSSELLSPHRSSDEPASPLADYEPASPGTRRHESPGQRTPVHGANQPATIIDLHPFRDIIAILLFLLQLPPWLVTSVHASFAIITFAPPPSGWSWSSITSAHEWLNSSGGNPSLIATVFSDFAALLIWLMIPFGQTLTLDFALGVIAIYLGGGVASRSGSTSSILICSSIIGVCHLFRFRGPRQHGINIIWMLMLRSPFKSFLSNLAPPIISDYRYIPHSWPRTLLELHIVAQGVVRIVRRHLSEPRGRSNDLDFASISTSMSNLYATNETITEGGHNTSTDGRPPGPPPTIRESREIFHSGRRRKKQATQVRSQQPFWAAIASTIISYSKNKEHMDASIDSIEARSTNFKNLGDDRRDVSEDRIWITEVNATDVEVLLQLVQRSNDEEISTEDEMSNDLSDTIEILVNGTRWTSIHADGEPVGSKLFIWQATITGLEESTNYMLQFKRVPENKIISSASIITRPATNTELSIQPSAAAQSLRPSSPTTTLRKSILTAEATLAEQRQRLKTKKKDSKHSTTSLKKEIEIMNNRLSTAGGNDEKQKQRQLQIQQHIRQAEDALSDMTSQLEDIGEIPRDEVKASAASKAKWQEQRDHLKTQEKEFQQRKSSADRQVSSAKAELAATIQKRERAVARLAKLVQQHDNSVQLQAERAKRDHDRASAMQHYRNVEQNWIDTIDTQQRRLDELGNSQFQINHQINYLQNNNLNHQSHGSHSMSSIPESPDFPAYSNDYTSVAHHSGFQPPQNASKHADLSRNRTDSMRGTRERASSMLSTASGYTDDAMGIPPTQPTMPFQYLAKGGSPVHVDRERKGSDASGGSGGQRRKGSGSGSGSGSSHRDRNSPAPRMSPIGTGLRKESPR